MKATPRRLLIPVFERRERQKDDGKGGVQYKDTIQWMQERSAHILSFDFREQAHIQLIIGLAAIHTTGMATNHMLYDLAARQEYVEPLREEVQRVLGQDGGKLTKQGLGRLMDSFMKESERLNPIALSESSLVVFNLDALSLFGLCTDTQCSILHQEDVFLSPSMTASKCCQTRISRAMNRYRALIR